MKSQESTFVTIAEAHSEVEAIKLKMLLDRTGIPYFVRGDQLTAAVGELYGSALSGPRQFVVPARFQAEVEELIQEMFTLDNELPETCPACETPTQSGKLECPECGLYLA